MTIGELKKIVDSIHELHGPEAWTTFVYQKTPKRVGNGDITSFRVTLGLNKLIHFNVDYPRGEAE